MWAEIRKLFPICERCVYLNNAGVCPPSLRVLEALEAHHRNHALHGWGKVRAEIAGTEVRIKEILAGLLGCKPSSIALVHNTSEGMSIVAQGLSWRPGDVVVGLDREYPANVYPWVNLQAKGVRHVRLRPTHSNEDIVLLESSLDPSVKVVAVSAVDWCTGHVYDLARLGEACRERGIWLVADVAQAMGTVPVDAASTHAAALAGSAWKGLTGPLGVGVFYCSDPLLERLSLSFVGTDTVVHPQSYLDYRFTPKPDASRFQFSTPNVNDWVHLRAALELLNQIGFEKVRGRILELTSILQQGLERKGYAVAGSTRPAERSGILSFRREGLDARRKAAELAGRGIVVVERDGFVRVSPHVYNNEEDMDRLLRALD
ncbi:MAG: aminotransferase class V-fold PLP-dependent enzyme [bacterium]